MNKHIILAASKKIKTWKSEDGTRYGRDRHGSWIRLGYESGMTDKHLVEYVQQLERSVELSHD